MMRTLLITVTVIVTACSRVTYPMDVDVVGTTVRDLVRGSDVVVVGTVEGEAGTINTARDPRDITRPHSTLESIAQLYRVRVEEAFKGGPKPEVIVAVSRWSSNVGEVGRENWPQFIALEQAQRYVLFLRLVLQPVGPYYVVAEPGRFKLNAQAVVQSPWRNAPQFFPARDSVGFLAELRVP